MSTLTVLGVIRASAAYDVVATAAFALPWTAPFALDSLIDVHESLGLSGALPQPHDVFTVLFANLLGSIVLVWSVLRLARPSLILGAADTVARVLFSTWMAAALFSGASTAVLAFLIPEVIWGIVQGAAVLRESGRR
jgi:hypothetical protein